MSRIHRVARSFSNSLGHESPVIKFFRPTYNCLLRWSSGERGLPQLLNGHETFRIDPQHRKFFPEAYDPEVCAYLRERVKPNSVSLSVGAHFGIYALCLATWSAPAGRVFAFEPNPYTRTVLQKHILFNNLGERVEIVPCAVSDTISEMAFFAATDLGGYSRLGQPNPDVAQEKHDAITTTVTTLDDFCRERNLAPDWFVMDIEGYEIAALAGARETIQAGRGRLGMIVEMHPNLWNTAGASRNDLEMLLAEMSLKPVPMTGQKDPLAEYGLALLAYR